MQEHGTPGRPREQSADVEGCPPACPRLLQGPAARMPAQSPRSASRAAHTAECLRLRHQRGSERFHLRPPPHQALCPGRAPPTPSDSAAKALTRLGNDRATANIELPLPGSYAQQACWHHSARSVGSAKEAPGPNSPPTTTAADPAQRSSARHGACTCKDQHRLVGAITLRSTTGADLRNQWCQGG
jgi:hypothetical protein